MINPRAEGWFALSVSWLKDTVGDIALKEKPKLPNGVSSAIHTQVSELLAHGKAKNILLSYNDAFANDTIVRLVSDAPLSAIILSLGLTEEQILDLSFELEKALNKHVD